MTIVEVLADNAFAAQAALTGHPDVISVTQLGVRLRALIPESVENPVMLVDSALGQQGLSAQTEIVHASLEDVFVAVTQKAPRADQ